MNRPLVFTNGVFDILHIGHVDYLKKARKLGARLCVGINSDASVRMIGKGKDRPINPLEHRKAMLRELRCVDEIITFDSPDPLAIINLMRPDIIVKGGDYKHADIIGAREVEAWGGIVVTIPFVHQVSTTQLIERMRA